MPTRRNSVGVRGGVGQSLQEAMYRLELVVAQIGCELPLDALDLLAAGLDEQVLAGRCERGPDGAAVVRRGFSDDQAGADERVEQLGCRPTAVEDRARHLRHAQPPV